MNVRKITLGSAALAAIVFCAMPASAAPNYTRNSTPAERAQTEALNSGAADRAHGNTAADNAARDNYNANRANYDRGLHDNQMQNAAYDREMLQYNSRYHRHGGSNNVLSISFGDVAFGYSDGYWDNGHRWHAWRNADEARGYRSHSGSNYHDWHHDRDGGHMGWMRN